MIKLTKNKLEIRLVINSIGNKSYVWIAFVYYEPMVSLSVFFHFRILQYIFSSIKELHLLLTHSALTKTRLVSKADRIFIQSYIRIYLKGCSFRWWGQSSIKERLHKDALSPKIFQVPILLYKCIILTRGKKSPSQDILWSKCMILSTR